MKDINTIEPIDRNEMVGLATEEYQRLLELFRSLDAGDWSKQTVCDDWTVHLMVAHLLGAADSNASLLESMRQLRSGKKAAREMDAEDIDGINAVQVEARRHLSPTELIVPAVPLKRVRIRRPLPSAWRSKSN